MSSPSPRRSTPARPKPRFMDAEILSTLRTAIETATYEQREFVLLLLEHPRLLECFDAIVDELWEGVRR